MGLGVLLILWFRLACWKVLAASILPVVLALSFPSSSIPAVAAGALGLGVITSQDRGESFDWFTYSWGFLKQILPLFLCGVLVAGFLLGRIGHAGTIASGWMSSTVGGNSLWANFFASIAGAFLYFAKLNEVPILQGLMANGMGKGPFFAPLLAGPALSLRSMLVINKIMDLKKTFVYVALAVVMATFTDIIYGKLF